MRFKALDLNLIVALDALLTTRSVARAAEQLCLSQPATSAALSRLRIFFKDPLLVAEGRRFHLTAAAQTLLPLARQCLNDADAMITAAQRFDPATSRRTFKVVASDYTAILIMTGVASHLARYAPGISLEILPPPEDAVRQLRDGLIDLLIGPEHFVSMDQPEDLLFKDRHVLVGCKDNPLLDRALTIDDLRSARYVVATFGPRREPSFGDQQVAAVGVERNVEVRVGTFAALPWFLRGTRRLAIMHERLARFFEQTAQLSIAELPFSIPDLNIVQQYHRTRADDPGLTWFRELVRNTAFEAALISNN